MRVERSFSSVNGRSGKFGPELTGFLICLTIVLSAFIAMVPTVEEGEGYDYTNIYGTTSSDYIAGYIRQSGTSHNKYSGYAISGHYYTYHYRGWFGISVESIDERSLISSAYAYFYPTNIFYSQNCYFYLLDFDPSQTANAQTIFDRIDDGYYLGFAYVSSYSTISSSITGDALSYLKNRISEGTGYVFFGIIGTDTSTDYITWSYSNQYLRIYGDRSPPSTPSLSHFSQYQTASSMYVSCSSVSDQPSGTNYGNVRYQVGLFSSTSLDSLIRTSDWTSSTSTYINDMADGSTYYIRARAKDGGGWISDWSMYGTTTVDMTPPTIPQIFDLPEYTDGTTVDLAWTPSSDYTSGLDHYQINYAPNPDFTGEMTENEYAFNYRAFAGLTSGTTYYFVLSAYDDAGLWSGFSSICHTTIDADPPSVPVMMKEPPFTPGDNNTFQWHPSIDDGVGVHHYKVQLSTTDEFLPADIVHDVNVDDTLVRFEGLSDMQRYYARVKAVDDFDHGSDWSEMEWSVQDHSGPGELGLEPLMEYMPEGDVPLVWEGSEDAGSGVGWYKVSWSQDPTFSTGVTERDHVLGQSFQVPDLEPGNTWYFKVTSYDLLGNAGEEETAVTTIDGEPPSQPLIDPIDAYSGGRTRDISWSGSTDALSGLDHYVVNVYTSADRVGLAFTVRTTGTEYTVPGLSDGTTYHYEVVAVDNAGNLIASPLIHSTQDTLGPSVPGIMLLNEMSSTGLIDVEWSASTDGSGGPVEYQVEWSADRLFSEEIQTSPWLDDNHYTVHDSGSPTRAELTPLQDGTYYIRVRSRDRFEQMSSYGATSMVVVDTTPPAAPVLDPIDEYSGATSLKITWAPVEDGASTEIEYQVRVYGNETGEPLMVSPWTTANEVVLTGLDGGTLYYMRLVAKDELGWESEPSEAVRTTIDITPPVLTVAKGGLFGLSDTDIRGTVSDGGCGVKRVELSHDTGLSWSQCSFSPETGEWSFPKSALPAGVTSVLVRALDNGGNLAPSVPASLDNFAPSVAVGSPLGGSEVNGAVQITGSVTDANLDTYSVEYRMDGDEDWTAIVAGQRSGGASGLLATWVTSGLLSGAYTIRVGGVDSLGQSSYKTVNVTLVGAVLGLEPSQITFSNPRPVAGEKVKVMVTVSNYGDSPAEGVTVTVYDGGEEIDRFNEVVVPANGFITLTTEMTADGKHEITARATSDMYDTGEMVEGPIVETLEDELVLEDVGGLIGLIALLLALVALILAVVLGLARRKEKPPIEEKEEEAEDEVKEEAEEEKKPPAPPAAPALQPATTEPQAKPELPSSPQSPQQREQLPPPNVSLGSIPTQGSAPTEPPQFRQPQLNAAPANEAPSPEKAQGFTYMGPSRK